MNNLPPDIKSIYDTIYKWMCKKNDYHISDNEMRELKIDYIPLKKYVESNYTYIDQDYDIFTYGLDGFYMVHYGFSSTTYFGINKDKVRDLKIETVIND